MLASCQVNYDYAYQLNDYAILAGTSGAGFSWLWLPWFFHNLQFSLSWGSCNFSNVLNCSSLGIWAPEWRATFPLLKFLREFPTFDIV